MDVALHVLGLFLLLLLCLIAAFSLVLGLPGTVFLVAIAAVYGWLTAFAGITASVLAWLVGLALLGEGFELLSATLATGEERPSRHVSIAALVGAVVGGLVGTPFLFGIGSLIGALAGAFAGATLASRAEGRATRSAIAAGFAAMRGRLLGFVVKTAIAAVMIVLIFASAL